MAKYTLKWWLFLKTVGPKFGYFPKATKSWLIVKPDEFEEAKSAFDVTDINVTCEGRRHLGAVWAQDRIKKSTLEIKLKSGFRKSLCCPNLQCLNRKQLMQPFHLALDTNGHIFFEPYPI